MIDKANRNDYFEISVEMQDGFKFKVPARGYNLKSLLEFEQSLGCVKKYSHKQIDQAKYEKMIYGYDIHKQSPGDFTERGRSNRTAASTTGGNRVERGRRTGSSTGRKKTSNSKKEK